jgi:hypothetical protein
LMTPLPLSLPVPHLCVVHDRANDHSNAATIALIRPRRKVTHPIIFICPNSWLVCYFTWKDILLSVLLTNQLKRF